MKKDNLKQIISECCNDILFNYNGLDSGITAEVANYVPRFQAWHGEKIKEYKSVDDVINDKFYSGKSLIDLIGIVVFEIT